MSTTNPICPYCGDESALLSGDKMYPGRGDLAGKWFYRCRPCDASVGCHPGSKKPLGTLANKALRQQRQLAHAAFDPLWKKDGRYRVFNSRSDAYTWLAVELGLEEGEAAHIGASDTDTCKQIIELCRKVEVKWDELGGNKQMVESWMVDRMERADIVREERTAAKTNLAIAQAEAQRAKFESDARWGSW